MPFLSGATPTKRNPGSAPATVRYFPPSPPPPPTSLPPYQCSVVLWSHIGIQLPYSRTEGSSLTDSANPCSSKTANWVIYQSNIAFLFTSILQSGTEVRWALKLLKLLSPFPLPTCAKLGNPASNGSNAVICDALIIHSVYRRVETTFRKGGKK